MLRCVTKFTIIEFCANAGVMSQTKLFVRHRPKFRTYAWVLYAHLQTEADLRCHNLVNAIDLAIFRSGNTEYGTVITSHSVATI